MNDSSAFSTTNTKFHKSRSPAAVVTPDHIFKLPTKLIKTPTDMKIWEKSEAYFEYLGFILAINSAIKGKSNSQGTENASESCINLVGLLDKLDALIDETPPIQQPQRFGNAAFKTWYQKMRDGCLTLLEQILPHELYKSISEIVHYLTESFGNSTRIDYGTGHEISFLMFLCCLFKISFLKKEDEVPIGCYVFPRYLDLVRKLQKTYRMEPAGSHGVWSLDDYQFVPFIWGSSQLIAHPTIEPASFLNQSVLNEYGEDYMFLTCIQFINSVKSGPFAEHSNQLWSISGVSSWTKINGGLVKMYKAEVLSKFPVVQHIVFGSLLTLLPVEQSTGFMTPKTSMCPPPVPSLSSSSSSRSEESQRFAFDTQESPALSKTSTIRSKASTVPSTGPQSRDSSAASAFSDVNKDVSKQDQATISFKSSDESMRKQSDNGSGDDDIVSQTPSRADGSTAGRSCRFSEATEDSETGKRGPRAHHLDFKK